MKHHHYKKDPKFTNQIRSYIPSLTIIYNHLIFIYFYVLLLLYANLTFDG